VQKISSGIKSFDRLIDYYCIGDNSHQSIMKSVKDFFNPEHKDEIPYLWKNKKYLKRGE